MIQHQRSSLEPGAAHAVFTGKKAALQGVEVAAWLPVEHWRSVWGQQRPGPACWAQLRSVKTTQASVSSTVFRESHQSARALSLPLAVIRTVQL